MSISVLSLIFKWKKYLKIFVFSERRVIYDYEKYGDSPACLGEENDLDQQIGLVQGFGITEDGTAPDNVLEANVTIISNSKCTSEMDKMSKLYTDEISQALPNGLSDILLCTQGIWNKKKSVFTVSFINTYLTTCMGFLWYFVTKIVLTYNEKKFF